MTRRFVKLILLSLLVTLTVAISLNYFVTRYGIAEAQEHIRDILLSNRGFHNYIQRVMHPTFFQAMAAGEIKEDFYDPALLSSTYIVRTQHQFFNELRQEEGLPPVYYKLAANNPRNPVNKADERESRLIEQFNADRQLKENEEIVTVDGHKFIYYAVPFLENQARCMRCHGDPEDAPIGLRALYPEEGGFHEHIGEIRAIESIRMPVDEHFNTAYIVTGAASSGVFALLILTFVSAGLRSKVKTKTAHLVQEIDQRKRAEENYREVVEGTSDLITKVDSEGRFTYVNAMGEKVFGLSSEELRGKSAFEFIHPDDREYTLAKFAECVRRRQKHASFENRQVNRKSGAVFHMLWTTNAHYDESGAIVYLTGIARDITERKQWENRLIESERQLRQAQQIAQLGFWDLDILTGGLYWSDETFIMYGFAPQEFSPTFDIFRSIVHPDDLDYVQQHVDAALNDGEPYSIDFRFHLPSGKVRHLHTQGEVTRNSSGEAIRFMGTQVDITERKETELALIESERRYKMLVEMAPIPIFVHVKGKIVYTNNAVVKAFGALSQQEILGRSPMEFVHPEMREVVKARIQSIYDQQLNAPQIEERLLRVDGSEFTAEVCGSMIEFEGEPASQVMFIDISERKRAEEALRVSKETLALAQSVAGFGSWVWDLATNELHWSEETYDIFGFDKSRAPQFDEFAASVHNDDREEVSRAINRAIQEKSLFDIKYRIIRNAVVRHVHAKGKVLFNDQDEAFRMLGMIYDITEQVKAQESIAASLKEKEVLLKEVHHRVKNNMAVISSLLSLQCKFIHDPKYLQIFKESQSRIRTMALVHEKLYQQEHFSSIDVRDYLSSLASSVQHTFSSNPALRLSLDIEKVEVDLDTLVPCGLIVNELLTNAMKHAFDAQENPVISLSLTHLADNRIRLIIADNGAGLPTGFDLSANASLGLKLVETLVSQLDGTFTMESDHGARFTITCQRKIEFAGRGDIG